METDVTPKRSLFRRFAGSWKALTTAGVAVAALAMTAGATLGGFSASIANGTNTFSSGTIQLKAGIGATSCYSTGTGSGGSITTNSGTCATENDFGGTLSQVPGGTALTTTITLTNVGTVATATSSLAPTACSQANASDDNGYFGSDASFCNKVDVTIFNSTLSKCVYPSGASTCPALSNTYNLSTLGSGGALTTNMSPLASSASATYVVTAQLDGTAATNADQGLTATVPLTWSITQ